MTATVQRTTRNGVDLPRLFDTLDALKGPDQRHRVLTPMTAQPLPLRRRSADAAAPAALGLLDGVVATGASPVLVDAAERAGARFR
jgi:hypothetical protein